MKYRMKQFTFQWRNLSEHRASSEKCLFWKGCNETAVISWKCISKIFKLNLGPVYNLFAFRKLMKVYMYCIMKSVNKAIIYFPSSAGGVLVSTAYHN